MQMDQFRKAFSESRFEDFIAMSRNFEPAETNLIEFLELKGRALQRLDLFEEALGIWNVLISKNEQDADYYNERGVCKFQLRFKSSLDDLDMAVKLDPDNAYHYACRAYIKDKLGNTEGSVEDYRISVSLDPENEVTHNNLGLAEEKLGYTQKAREHMKVADRLAGVKALDPVEPEVEQEEASSNSIWKELLKMVSSRKEFVNFLKEAFSKKK